MNQSIEIYAVSGFKYDDNYIQTINMHKHSKAYQIYYVAKGTVQYIYEQQEVTVSEGSFLLVEPLTLHGMAGCKTSSEVVDLKFSIRDNELAEHIHSKGPLFSCSNENIHSLFSMISQTASKKAIYFNRIAALHLEAILYITIQSNQAPMGEMDVDSLKIDFKNTSICTQRAIHAMEGFVVLPPTPPTPEAIAKLIGYNKRYMCNKFIEEVGISISQYMMLMQIDKAKELLQNSDLKVQEISKLLGFEDITLFNKSFKRCLGVNPREYRKQGKEQGRYLLYTFRGMNEETEL
jgi:AraC-like DNA-binding protein